MSNPSPPDALRATKQSGGTRDEIGLLTHVHPRGYGFAVALTGQQDGDVFLNESRITTLGARRENPSGQLIRMTIATQPDGRCSAVRARLLDLDDQETALLLWQHVPASAATDTARSCSMKTARPSVMPLFLLLAGSSANVDALLRPLASDIGAEFWRETGLLNALHLAPPDARIQAYAHHLGQAPARIFDSLYRSVVNDGMPCMEDWLDLLWKRFPKRRAQITQMLWKQEWSRFPPPARVRWAVRLSDLTTGDGPLLWKSVLTDLTRDEMAVPLWQYVGQVRCGKRALTRLQALPCRHPTALPLLLLLAGAQRQIDDLLRPLALNLDEAAWSQPELLNALHLAPAAMRTQVYDRRLREDPACTFDSLHLAVFQERMLCADGWLEQLWDSLPGHRRRIAMMARYGLHWHADQWPRDVLRWVRRGIELEPDSQDAWWTIATRAAGDDSQEWDEELEDWNALADAPWPMVDALARRRFPALTATIAALHGLAESSAACAGTDARAILDGLDDADHRLAGLWSNPPADDDDMARAVRAQMWTARAAEKCAISYLRQLGLEAEDVSIGQLRGPSGEWPLMDLKIEHRHGVDVKNLRRTVNGGLHSSRWKVKALKTDAAGAQVLLCGVSSPYTWFDDHALTCHAGETMRVLGVTGANEIQTLMRRFQEIFVLRPQTTSRLIEMPVWSWDYPATQYRARDAAFAALRDAVDALGASRLGRRVLQALPPLLFSLWDMPQPDGAWRPDAQQSAFLELVRTQSAQQQSGRPAAARIPRLPWLHLFLLHSWAKWRAQSTQADTRSLVRLFEWHGLGPDLVVAGQWSPQGTALEEEEDDPALDWAAHTTRARPRPAALLGIVDPADTIAQLLDSLSILERYLSKDQFIALSDLTLHRNGILVGTFPDGVRRTLLAHCGGRLEEKNIECGHRPLVYGKQESCSCGRLICEKCQCCSDGRYSHCQQQDVRLRRLRERREARRAPGSDTRGAALSRLGNRAGTKPRF